MFVGPFHQDVMYTCMRALLIQEKPISTLHVKLHDIFLILKVEKDMVESQLRKSQAFIASLQAQTQKNREKATKAEGR